MILKSCSCFWPQTRKSGSVNLWKKKGKKIIAYFGPCCFLLHCFSSSPTLFPVVFAFILSLLCWASLEENFTPTSSTINSLPSLNFTLLFANIYHYFFINFFFFKPTSLSGSFPSLTRSRSCWNLFPPFFLAKTSDFLKARLYLFCMIHFCLPSSSVTFFLLWTICKLYYACFHQGFKLLLWLSIFPLDTAKDVYVFTIFSTRKRVFKLTSISVSSSNILYPEACYCKVYWVTT